MKISVIWDVTLYGVLHA